VISDLDGKVDVILAGGDCRIGIESTVVDMTVSPPEILRPGILTADMLSAAIDAEVAYDRGLLDANLNRSVQTYEDSGDGRGGGDSGSGGDSELRGGDPDGKNGAGVAPRSPGMKYRHYAPKAEMLVVEGQIDKVKAEIERLKRLNESIGNKVGVLLFDEKAYIEAAHDFYARLRALDAEGADLILAGALSAKDGVGFAVMNRMMKSAGYNIAKI
jgi:L-threonylcarbamoyladenylate synthase